MYLMDLLLERKTSDGRPQCQTVGDRRDLVKSIGDSRGDNHSSDPSSSGDAVLTLEFIRVSEALTARGTEWCPSSPIQRLNTHISFDSGQDVSLRSTITFHSLGTV